ncbi:DUF2764 family protein [Falsiporphyromonas endometrii]|uniref:DUF2764 family protein n=1 Tax=Falsiporphyromonas endometrii TaxID=1387297 RepID=A0ABV9K8D3_9PORP
MAKYYATAAGLPNIAVEDKKLPFSTDEYLEELQTVLTKKDKKLLDLFLWEKENKYLLHFLEDADKAYAEEDKPTLFSYRSIAKIVEALQDENKPKLPKIKGLPKYFYTFIKEQISVKGEDDDPDVKKKEKLTGVKAMDRLAQLFYDFALNCNNDFLKQWFELNLNLKNILAAHTAIKLGWEPKDYVVGNNSIAEKLKTSKQKDFGIKDELDYLPEILKIAEESDITKRERMIDLLKWNWLEEACFVKVFDIERLICYYLQLSIIERWVSLDEKTGEMTFRKIVTDLKAQSTDSLEEFKRNQKK